MLQYNFYLQIPPPYIESQASDEDVIFAGSNLTLTCSLFVEPSTPFINLKWTIPDGITEQDLKTGRVIVEEQAPRIIYLEQRRARGIWSRAARLERSSQRAIERKLTIKEVKHKDVGEYSCTAEVPGTNKEDPPIKTSLPTVWPLEHVLNDHFSAFINEPEFHGDAILTMTRPNLTARWIFTLEANPDPGFTWYSPDGTEIDHLNYEKYKMVVDSRRDNVKLNISHVTLMDVGQYVFQVEVRGGDGEMKSANISLGLRLLQAPKVKAWTFLPEKGKYLHLSLNDCFPPRINWNVWKLGPSWFCG